MQMRIPSLALMAAGGLAVAGCPNAELAPLEPCTVSGVVQEVTQNAVDKVDVLFVIDNSGSMAQEQAALSRELPRMVQILASGQNGDLMFPAVTDMHLGVVSSDMGAAGQDTNPNDPNNCENPGDDGILQAMVSSNPGCSDVSVNGNYLAFNEGDDPEELGEAFACITRLGTQGCGQEQQLDAMLKALTPPTSDIRFFNDSVGHGGNDPSLSTPNNGFLRENAVLAVILVTDEDDCSVPDENGGLLAGHLEGPYADTPVNLRCGLNPDLQYPVERYINGLLALKPNNPELVIFAAITGIPTELQGESADTILSDPRMEFRSDRDISDLMARPVPSCSFENPDDPEMPQQAFPPRRIVQTAAGFGENGTVQSICQNDFSGALDNIIEKISQQLRGACLPRELTRNDQGIVECDIVEVIADTQGQGEALCMQTPGRTPERVDIVIDEETGQETRFQVCKINQVAVTGNTANCAANVEGCLAPNPEAPDQGLVGWYYDNFSAEVLESCTTTPQRITFTSNATPPGGAVVRFECLQPVLDFGDNPKGQQAAGLSCENNIATCDAASTNKFKLICEEKSNTCQITCKNLVDCPNGWQCQKQGMGMGNQGLCINPTCPAVEL